MIQLSLTEAQATFLEDVIVLWCEGYDDAKELTHQDPTFESADEFLMLTSSLVDQQRMADEIREQLKKAAYSG